MNQLKPKEQHEQLLAATDHELIVEHLNTGRPQDVAKIAVTLACQCDLFVHFLRLWKMRVAGLDEKLSTESYTRNIYVNRRALYKELVKTSPA